VRAISALALSLACMCALLGGCRKDPNDVANMSRADQEKAFRGDPKRGMVIGAQMRARYLGGGAQQAPSTDAAKQNEAIQQARRRSRQ